MSNELPAHVADVIDLAEWRLRRQESARSIIATTIAEREALIDEASRERQAILDRLLYGPPEGDK